MCVDWQQLLHVSMSVSLCWCASVCVGVRVCASVCVCGREVGSDGKGVLIQGGESERDGRRYHLCVCLFLRVCVSACVFIFLCTEAVLLTAETAVLCMEADKKNVP